MFCGWWLLKQNRQSYRFNKMACSKREISKVGNNMSNSSGTCRVCMRKNSSMKELFGPDSKIVERIQYCTGILLTENPISPSFICPECYSQLNIAHNFKTTCIKSENTFQQLHVKVDVKTEESDKPAVKVEVEYLYEDEAKINDLQETGFINKKITDPKRSKKHKVFPTTNPIQYKAKLCCRRCNIRFATNEECFRHYQDVHITSKYICEVCGKQFLYIGLYNSHMLKHKEGSLQCAHCSYSTNYKADLGKHLAIHTGEKKYQCHMCPLKFRTSSNLHAHIRFKHLGKRPFSCNLCDKSFVTQYCLNIHAATHNQTKQYACNLCNSRFSDRNGWKRHLLNHHAVSVPRAKPGRRKNNLDVEATTSSIIFDNERDKIKNNLPVI